MAWSGYLCEVVLILVDVCFVLDWGAVAEGGEWIRLPLYQAM
jgi:hypothetical protein